MSQQYHNATELRTALSNEIRTTLSTLVTQVRTANSPVVITPASTVPYVNTSVGLQQVIIVAGTVSAVALTRNSISITLPASNEVFLLSPGDSFTATYTVAPTMTVMQLT